METIKKEHISGFEYPLHRTAVVVDVGDPEETGRIKVRIQPELNGVDEENLPWASPHTQGKRGAMKGGSIHHNVPDPESRVHAIVYDKYWRTIDYVVDESYRIPGYYQYRDIVEKLEEEIEDLESPEYPNPSITKAAEGTTFFENHETKEVGLLHPSGLYVLVTADGNAKIRVVDSAKLMNEDESLMFNFNGEDGKVELKVEDVEAKIDGSGGKVELKAEEVVFGDGSDYVARYTPIENILSELLSHKHVAPSGQTTPPLDSSQKPLSSLKPDLRDIQSQIITTD